MNRLKANVASVHSEIRNWMEAWLKYQETLNPVEARTVDVNGDGVVNAADETIVASWTSLNDLISTFVAVHSVPNGEGTIANPGYDDRSPWGHPLPPLYTVGNPGPGSGQIGLTAIGNTSILIQGWDNDPTYTQELLTKIASAE